MAEYKNPSQDGGAGGGQNNSSFLIMIVVMFGVLFGLQYWRAKHNPQTQDESATAQHAVAPASAPAPVPTPLGTNAGPGAANTPAVQAAAESTTVVENAVYRITFSNRGGQVSSWVLKNFKDADGNPLDLVHEDASKQFGFPLSLYTYDPALTAGLAQALYVPSATGTLSVPSGTRTLSYMSSMLMLW